MYDKPLNRKQTSVKFNPKQALDLLQTDSVSEGLDDDAKRLLVVDYLNVSVLRC